MYTRGFPVRESEVLRSRESYARRKRTVLNWLVFVRFVKMSNEDASRGTIASPNIRSK